MSSYRVIDNDGSRLITVFTDDGEILGCDENHRNFDRIYDLVVNQGDYTNIDALFDPSIGIVDEFHKIGTEVSIRGGVVHYEGVALRNVLADKIVDVFESGLDYKPFVLFLEKLYSNPLQHSIDNLYRWLEQGDFVIASDGDIIGYKGLRVDNTSVHAAPARDRVVRNGAPIEGHVPNEPGDVIEMDREFVQHDPSEGCSYGLHVGTYDYARGFGHSLVKVKVNPKYVVSVPTESGSAKMRVCRYEVVGPIDDRIDSPYDYYYNDDDQYDDEFVDADPVDEPVQEVGDITTIDLIGTDENPAELEKEFSNDDFDDHTYVFTTMETNEGELVGFDEDVAPVEQMPGVDENGYAEKSKKEKKKDKKRRKLFGKNK